MMTISDVLTIKKTTKALLFVCLFICILCNALPLVPRGYQLWHNWTVRCMSDYVRVVQLTDLIRQAILPTYGAPCRRAVDNQLSA